MNKRIHGLGQIAKNYDAMLIDQFGVIHDGQNLYAGASEVLAKLHALKIPIVVMSNSGKRSTANVTRLVNLGVPRQHFNDVVSSGEVAYHKRKSNKVFVIGKRGEDYGLDNLTQVGDPSLAEELLILGSNCPETSMEVYRQLLQNVKLPAICCNPDKQMLTPHGLQPAPGAIAALYESLGGQVTWIGKPYPAIYQHALELLGNPKRVLCIGDSPEHDVGGGKAMGLDTCLVQQGIAASLYEYEIEPKPDYMLQEFRW
jgi:HAD superfamily hydrolase (TIGR01459 family)